MNKKIVLAFLLGVILSGSIVYAGTMYARDVDFDNTKSQLKDSNNQNVDNVQDAIDALYTKANNQVTYDEYSGTTTYTPSTITQTVPTNNKLLKSNITINPIPASYKELATPTTATANDILSGKTAYNNSGQLITGSNVSTVYTTSNVYFKHFDYADGVLNNNKYYYTIQLSSTPKIFAIYGNGEDGINNFIIYSTNNFNNCNWEWPFANHTDVDTCLNSKNLKAFERNGNNILFTYGENLRVTFDVYVIY